MNHTFATPLISGETSVNSNTTLLPPLANYTANLPETTTLHPTSNTSAYYHNSNLNYTIQNASIHNPDDPNYITIGTPFISYSYTTYSYTYYVFLILLVVAAIICIKIGILRRRELEKRAAAERRRALQQVETAYVVTTGDNNNCNSNNSTTTNAKDLDLPPTYEDVVQFNMLHKQQQLSTQGTPVGNENCMTTENSSNTLSEAVSTATIETEISNSNNAIAVNMNHQTTSR